MLEKTGETGDSGESGDFCESMRFVFLKSFHSQKYSICKIYGLYGLKHHIVEMRGDVTMRDGRTMTNEQVKIELHNRWKLEAEFRNFIFYRVLWAPSTY